MTVMRHHTKNLLSVIIAARNEERYIGACLDSILQQDTEAGNVEVIVMANACTDDTVGAALSMRPGFDARGWTLHVMEEATPGKMHALNSGDRAAKGDVLDDLDADVIGDTDMFAALRTSLTSDAPLYATGVLQVAEAQSCVIRQSGNNRQTLHYVR